MQLPVVSAIIPCYNCRDYLAEAIESALLQTHSAVEVIVIDDASTDGSYEVAQQYLPRIKLLRNERNRERSYSRNRAIRESSGQFIALLDADDMWLPHKIERQMSFVRQHPGIGMVYARAALMDSQSQPFGDGVIIGLPPSGESVCTPRGQSLLMTQADIPCVTTLFLKKAFESVGGFDETPWLQKCGEDYEFFWRLSEEYAVGFMDEVLARHRRHSSQTTANVMRSLLITHRATVRYIARSRRISDKRGARALMWAKIGPRIEQLAGAKLWREQDYWKAVRLYWFIMMREPRRAGIIRGFVASAVRSVRWCVSRAAIQRNDVSGK